MTAIRPDHPTATPSGAASRAPRQGTPQPVLLRKLAAHEHALVAAHLRRLSEHDRAMRFMAWVPDAHIDNHCQRRHAAGHIMLGCFEAGTLRAVAEIVFDTRPAWRGGCELALSVETAWQRRGLGSLLMRRAIGIARNRCAAPLRILFRRENQRMRTLALRHGMTLSVRDGEVLASLRPTWPDHLSFLLEGIGDGLEWWSRWAQPGR